ncbi:hypothetical protein [uncultured Culturomica sp.]|jgi:hypothetical protein|uniref:hypothetical protein n=1 Tax=uncultured Culturomica sp. TaxID=1926654 RepID=UPI00033CAB99|nr:hypothetical protein [uncultured Culturomica sp.]CCZ10496.1 putative uncharacterized protein [Odoribacter sp. CAG:788]
MRVIENKYLPPAGYGAIMLFGVIFVRTGVKLSPRTIRHEEIHKRQMIEMLVLFFYLWYGIEWLIRLIQYRNRKEAYRNISFEREAYANDELTPYDRTVFAWTKYLKNND